MSHQSSTSTRSEQCHELPACPACGQLTCLCRPRFFAGQILTEEDLNRLEHYVIEKNKLHNRYLHGWGVVCGLEVACSPCDDKVHVKTGYALSPCGEDIIVCKDDTVDVCALIQACRPVSSHADCESPRAGSDEGCQDATEDWVLAICYDEKPSRGITALRGSSGAACGSRCSCGGSSACGCSGHNHSYSSTSGGKKNGNGCRPTQPNPPPQCEPTLTCEGYSYRVYKLPKRKEEDRRDPGALVTRALACLNELTSQIGALSDVGVDQQKCYEWYCAFKETLRDFLVTQGIYDCQLADKLATIRCPDPTHGTWHATTGFEAEWRNALQQLSVLLWEFLKSCICSALLPPCPEPVMDDCVPLATVTVRRNDCRIVKVCNWGPRKFAITLPNLGYWLSVFTPYAQVLHRAIDRICCRPLQLREAGVKGVVVMLDGSSGKPNMRTNAETTGFVAPGAKMTPERELSTLLYEALLNPKHDAQELLVLHALGATDSKGEPALSGLESRNPLQFLLLNQVVAPLIRSSIPEQTKGLAAELATLRETVERLTRTVERPQRKAKKGKEKKG